MDNNNNINKMIKLNIICIKNTNINNITLVSIYKKTIFNSSRYDKIVKLGHFN